MGVERGGKACLLHKHPLPPTSGNSDALPGFRIPLYRINFILEKSWRIKKNRLVTPMMTNSEKNTNLAKTNNSKKNVAPNKDYYWQILSLLEKTPDHQICLGRIGPRMNNDHKRKFMLLTFWCVKTTGWWIKFYRQTYNKECILGKPFWYRLWTFSNILD